MNEKINDNIYAFFKKNYIGKISQTEKIRITFFINQPHGEPVIWFCQDCCQDICFFI